MDGTESNSLDRAYLTIDDFLNSRYIRSDDVDHTLSPDDLEVHFNKPGFDLAIIITDTSLISRIADFQTPFQSKHGFTTHVIYLPDLSRLTFCIRDLKQHEILYVIVVNENSFENDDYDIFILSDIIEFQKSMKYQEAVELINEDFLNYTEQVKNMLHIPEKYPHPSSKNIPGFIQPDDNIRYLLCLLFDHRMLKTDELQTLSTFVKRRKEALLCMGNKSVNYAMNDRPMPQYRQDKLKYYIYEQKQDQKNEIEEYFNHENRKITHFVPPSIRSKATNGSKPDVDLRLAQSQVVTRRPLYAPIPSRAPTVSAHTAQKPNSTFSKTAIISSAPKLYTNSIKPAETSVSQNSTPVKTAIRASINTPLPIKNLFPKPAITNVVHVNPQPKTTTPQLNRVPPPPAMKAAIQPQVLKSTTGNSTLPSATRADSTGHVSGKVKFSINPISKPPPITHSTVVHKQTPSNNENLGVALLHSNKDNVTSSCYDDLLPELDEDGNAIVYHLSPVSSVSSDNVGNQGIADISSLSSNSKQAHSKRNLKIEIDLTDDVINRNEQHSSPPLKKSKNNPEPVTTSKPEPAKSYLVDLAADSPSVQPKTCIISSDGFINFFKFVLNLAPFDLPEHNVVMLLMKKCIVDIERYAKSLNLSIATVDIRACKTGGCVEIIRIIEQLCGETMASKHNASDLNFMWTYFPRNITENSITIMFYKLMKILELTKLAPSSTAILVNMIQRLERVVNYYFHISDSKYPAYTIINFFPSLFSEYFDLRAELRSLNLALPPAEPVTVIFNTDLNMAIVENKIKFMIGPLLEFFINKINSIHNDLEGNVLEVIYGAVRVTRFSLRKISMRILSDCIKDPVVSGKQGDRTLALINEINLLIREVSLMNSILFTKRHYDLVNLLLDFSIKIDDLVTVDPDMDPPDREHLTNIDSTKFVHELSTTVKTAVLPYHPDTEIEVLKRSLKNRWIDTLHQSFKGVGPAPDGNRIAKEILYLLPKSWGKHTFNEAVMEAAMLSYSDWDKMLTNDFSKARLTYTDVRNNYLIWLANNGLDHRKAMECMTSYQKMLDAKILMLSS